MSGTINNLLTSIKQGARSNKYRVIVDTDDGELDVLAIGCTMPGKSLTPVDVWYRGRKYQSRGETALPATLSVEFYNTSDLSHRHFFIDWMTQIHSTQVETAGQLEKLIPSAALSAAKNVFGNLKRAYNDVNEAVKNPRSLLDRALNQYNPFYEKNIKIFQLNGNEQETYYVDLIGAFPISVSDITYTNQAGDISTTTVEFAFTDILYNEEPKTDHVDGLLGSTLADIKRKI